MIDPKAEFRCKWRSGRYGRLRVKDSVGRRMKCTNDTFHEHHHFPRWKGSHPLTADKVAKKVAGRPEVLGPQSKNRIFHLVR